jgi:O-antigen/teichoic acid export membrane protein
MGMLSVQLLLPKAGMGGFVLSAGHLTAYIAGSFYLLIPLLKTIQARNPILCEILQTVKRNKGYPRFIAGGSLAISMVYNLNSYALSILYTTTQLGYYSLISRVLGAPLMLLGNSVGQVYLRRASACRKAAVRRHEFILVSLTLAVSALPIFVCLAWFARPMITVVFGTEWIPAAAMLRAMAPLYYIRLVVTPVMTAAIIQKKHRATMRWQLCMLAVSLLTALLAGIARWSIGTYVWSLSLALSAGYTVFYLFCLRTLQQAERRETVD